jgi:voltage-gated sodium channel
LIKDCLFVTRIHYQILQIMGYLLYFHSILGVLLFSKVHPDYFGNIYLAMLSLFQVFTFDAWNEQINMPIMASVGNFSAFYFVIFIFTINFFFVNFFLSAFVSYYSKSSVRKNFLYDRQHDPSSKESNL